MNLRFQIADLRFKKNVHVLEKRRSEDEDEEEGRGRWGRAMEQDD